MVVVMAKIKSLFQSSAFLLSMIVIGSLLAFGAAAQLRFAYPFRNLFPETCFYIRDEDVIPILVQFFFGLASMAVSSTVLLRRSAMFRRLLLGFAISALAFGIGLLVDHFLATPNVSTL